jgi:hypothetical protein
MTDEIHDYHEYFKDPPHRSKAEGELESIQVPGNTESFPQFESHLQELIQNSEQVTKQLLNQIWEASHILRDNYKEEWGVINHAAYETRRRTGRYENKPGRIWMEIKTLKGRDAVYLYWCKFTGNKIRIRPDEYLKKRHHIKNTGTNKYRYPLPLLRSNCEPWEYQIVIKYEEKLAILREMRDKAVKIRFEYERMVTQLAKIMEKQDVVSDKQS